MSVLRTDTQCSKKEKKKTIYTWKGSERTVKLQVKEGNRAKLLSG